MLGAAKFTMSTGDALRDIAARRDAWVHNLKPSRVQKKKDAAEHKLADILKLEADLVLELLADAILPFCCAAPAAVPASGAGDAGADERAAVAAVPKESGGSSSKLARSKAVDAKVAFDLGATPGARPHPFAVTAGIGKSGKHARAGNLLPGGAREVPCEVLEKYQST